MSVHRIEGLIPLKIKNYGLIHATKDQQEPKLILTVNMSIARVRIQRDGMKLESVMAPASPHTEKGCNLTVNQKLVP